MNYQSLLLTLPLLGLPFLTQLTNSEQIEDLRRNCTQYNQELKRLNMGYTEFIKVRDDLGVCFNVQQDGIHYNTNKNDNSSKVPPHMTVDECINQMRGNTKDSCT